jgi:hypothetical protein
MASQMKYNLKDARDLDAAFRLTWSGGWTYSATGATPNGTNAYADTKLVPSTNLSTSSAHFSKYNRTNDLVGNKVDGSIGGTSTFFFQQNYSAGNGIIGEIASIMSYSPTDTRGLFTSTRTSTSLAKQFRNSSQVASATTTILGMSDRSMFIGSRNDATVTFYNTYQVAFSSIGDGLTDQDAQLLNQIVEKYQVALSRGVQAAQSFYYNSAYSNEANTYLYSTQITGTTQVSAINTLINGLKANNLWSKMKAVYPFVTDKSLQADMAAQMKFNLVNPQDTDAAFRLAFSGGWTYSTNGAQPNGTNGYADTKLNPTTAINKDNSHISFYSRTNVSLYSDMGSGNGNGTAFVLSLRYDALNAQLGMIGGLYPTNAITSAQSIATGFGILSRTSSTLLKLFRNSTLLGSNTVTSGSVSSQTIYIGGVNDTLFPEYSSKQVAFSSIGDGLTDAEAALFYQLVQQFQTTLSRNV